MTIYLTGGITGDENYKERIAAAKRMLLRESEDQLDSTARYYGSPRADTVLNPAELPQDWPGKVYMVGRSITSTSGSAWNRSAAEIWQSRRS